MPCLNSELKTAFRHFYFDQVDKDEFNQWLWSSENLEAQLGGEVYQDLIEHDFSILEDRHSAKKVIERIYDGSLFIDRAVEIARAMVDGELGLIEGCHLLGDLHNRGCEEIPIEFVGYSSEFKDNEGFLDHYRERILVDLEKVQALGS